MMIRSTMMSFFGFVLCLLVALCTGKKAEITYFYVPPYVELGSRVEMECTHNLNENELNRISWFFNDTENILNFRPNDMDKPHSETDFVDLNESTGARLVIAKVSSVDLTGDYRCEVTPNEEPWNDKKKIIKHATMIVMVIPAKNDHPNISPMPDDSLRIGEKLDLNCTSAASIPTAKLKWTINGKEVDDDDDDDVVIREYEPIPSEDNRGVKSRLGLKFKVQKKHFENMRLHIKCTATMLTEREERWKVHIIAHDNSTTVNDGGGAASNWSMGNSIIVCAVNVLLLSLVWR